MIDLGAEAQATHRRLRTLLLAWFRSQKRALPWRGTHDPYRIWVSEVMLQQTTVGAVRPRYEAFLERFPDLPALANAREQSVLAAWSGLGYYARARNLRRAAREVVEKHGGGLPSDPAVLRSLPGFGEYTASAVASLAFGRRVPAAEANVTRVLSRVFAIPGRAGGANHRETVLLHAAALLDRRRPGDVTAALMDLGQLVCRPRRPECSACPMASVCVARSLGHPERYPRRRPRPVTSHVFVAAACAVREDRALLIQRPGRLLGRLWQFPSGEGRSPSSASQALRRELAALGLRRERSARPFVTRHTIVHRRLQIRIYPAVPSSEPRAQERLSRTVRWLTPRELSAAAIPTLTRKIALAFGFLPGTDQRILLRDESHDVPPPTGSQRRARPRSGGDSPQGRNRLHDAVASASDRQPLRVHDVRRTAALSRGGGGR